MSMVSEEIIFADQALLPDGWAKNVVVTVGIDGRISSIERDATPSGTRRAILLAAPSNLHSHAFQRSMAGMMLEAKRAGLSHLINEDNVCDYAPVGCLENTMQGNDEVEYICPDVL